MIGTLYKNSKLRLITKNSISIELSKNSQYLLQLSLLIYSFFVLILIVSFDEVLNIIKEGLVFTQALTQESLEFFSGNRDIGLVFYHILILLLSKQDYLFENDGSKWYFILVYGSGGGKIVFILLEKDVSLQVILFWYILEV